jgi:hypothetical protein
MAEVWGLHWPRRVRFPDVSKMTKLIRFLDELWRVAAEIRDEVAQEADERAPWPDPDVTRLVGKSTIPWDFLPTSTVEGRKH